MELKTSHLLFLWPVPGQIGQGSNKIGHCYRLNFYKSCSALKTHRKLAFINPIQTNTFFSEYSMYPGISRVKCLNFGQRGASAVVQLMLSPLVLSVTLFNPSLKISLHQLRRESNCLWAISRILFLPATRYTIIYYHKMSFFAHFDPGLKKNSLRTPLRSVYRSAKFECRILIDKIGLL